MGAILLSEGSLCCERGLSNFQKVGVWGQKKKVGSNMKTSKKIRWFEGKKWGARDSMIQGGFRARVVEVPCQKKRKKRNDAKSQFQNQEGLSSQVQGILGLDEC